MTAYSLSADTNIDALTSKAGGDTYDTNGWVLTIDQDSRVGLNQTTSTTLGSITINATKGGAVNIDGTAIWLLAYTSGSGNVPAWNTTITQSGQSGTGKLIGVYSALTAASTATGAAMPTTGYIKIKQTSGTFTSGALTGITATSSGAGVVGWLDISGDEAATINANRLGTVNITGAWYTIGTTNGSSNQTMQIPNSGTLRYAAGVFIEQTAGAGDYEFYPNAGTTTTTGTEAARGKVVWIDNTGLVRIGNSGAATNGYTPVTGLAVVIGNVFLENNTTAARTANVIPNATIASRYDFTCTGGGVVNIDKCNAAWYLSFTQAYSVALTNCGTIDSLLLSECATAITWSKVGVGNKPTTNLLAVALTITVCTAGGTITNSVFARVSMASSSQYTVVMTDAIGFTFTDCTFRANTIQANATVYSVFATRIVDCTFTRTRIIQAAIALTSCINTIIKDTIYINCVSGTTVTTYTVYVVNALSANVGIRFDGLTFPVTNTHPYTALMSIASGTNGVRIRNIGTRSSPLTMGSANICGLIYVIATGASGSCFDIKVQRVYCSSTRTNTRTADNSTTRVTEENVAGDYADAPLANMLNYKGKGVGSTIALTAQTSVYGTHFVDCFTSTTVGRIQLMMNEASPLTAAYVTLANGAGFTSTGGLYMPTVGHSCIVEMDYYALGHTAFADSVITMAGGTLANYDCDYQIDLNDGAGYSGWKNLQLSRTGAGGSGAAYTVTMTDTTGVIAGCRITGTGVGTGAKVVTVDNGTTVTVDVANSGTVSGTLVFRALSTETLSASLGVKMKWRLVTVTTNTLAITSLYATTASTAGSQDYQYPLDPVTMAITVVDADGAPVAGAQTSVKLANTPYTQLMNLDTDASGLATGVYSYDIAGSAVDVYVVVRKSASGDSPRYKAVSSSRQITSDGLTATITILPVTVPI